MKRTSLVRGRGWLSVLAAWWLCATPASAEEHAPLASSDSDASQASRDDGVEADAPPPVESNQGSSPRAIDLTIAGAEAAFRAGRYALAIQAFDQARQLRPDPELTLSIAAAYEARFFRDGAEADRDDATAEYRAFLASGAGSDADRGRATQALDALADGALEPGAAGATLDGTFVVMLSPRLAARGKVDDSKPASLPSLVEVVPGEHEVKIGGPGYRTERRVIAIAEGTVTVLHADLVVQPARIAVEATEDALVYLDGQLVGAAPLEDPLSVSPGEHRVDVALGGHRTQTHTVSVPRGGEETITVDLDVTNQRVGSLFLIGAGATGIATAIVFGALATARDIEARETDDEAKEKQLEREGDDFFIVSSMAAGVGMGWAFFGGLLYIFDEPALQIGPGPGQAGVSIGGQF